MEWCKVKRIPKLDRKYVATKIWGILNIFKELCLNVLQFLFYFTLKVEWEILKLIILVSCLENLFFFRLFLALQSMNFLVRVIDIFNIEEWEKEVNFDFYAKSDVFQMMKHLI